MIKNANVEMLGGKSFVDLFCGIGCMRYALESFGAKCVFSSEWDEHCKDAYEANHGDRPAGDITQILARDIPKHDIICAGFPCQAFSISGKMKGFADERGRGNLFQEITRIASVHKPEMLILENVGNLLSHDGGNTLAVIVESLNAIGYDVKHRVLDASLFGVPQHRERIFFLCTYGKPAPFLTDPKPNMISLNDVLQAPDETRKYEIDVKSLQGFELDYSQKQARSEPIRVGKIQGGRQGERIYSSSGHAITLSSGGGGIGAKTGLYLVGDVVRRLSPRECARITGIPEAYVLPRSDSQAYRQFGNALVVDVVQRIVESAFSEEPEDIFAAEDIAADACEGKSFSAGEKVEGKANQSAE